MRSHRNLTSVRRPASLFAAMLLFAMIMGGSAEAAGRDVGPRPPGQFDYYVLSLSWVPGFCAIHRTHASECAQGLGFALHGLWPQLNGGAYPTDCDAVVLGPGEIQRYRGLYPDPSLVGHEWRKHGTCSGLRPAEYFALAARDRRRVRTPAAYHLDAILAATESNAVKSALMAANPGLPSDAMMAVTAKEMLLGIDICLSRNGEFRSC